MQDPANKKESYYWRNATNNMAPNEEFNSLESQISNPQKNGCRSQLLL